MPKLFSRPSFSEEKEAKDFYSSFGWALAGTQLHDAQTFSAGLPFSEEKEAKDFYSSFGWALAGILLHDA